MLSWDETLLLFLDEDRFAGDAVEEFRGYRELEVIGERV
jgi:hypothetical protein